MRRYSLEKFARLLENIIYSPSRNRKIELLVEYYKQTNDPDRGFAVALITNSLKLSSIRSTNLKQIIKSKVDPILFDLSYDYVGDMAETISLLWPFKKKKKLCTLSYFINFFHENSKLQVEKFLISQLDKASTTERWAIIKLFTGGLRIGVSEKNAKVSLSKFGNVNLDQIEKIWHGFSPPYVKLFSWLEKGGPIPKIDILKTFHPMMLADQIDSKNDFRKLSPDDFEAEWKWDGIRVQLIISDTETVIFSRNGDNITNSFPELRFKTNRNVVLDGELLVGGDLNPTSFNDLQQRLNRKKVSKGILQKFPAFIKLYDILFQDFKDLRSMKFSSRREILENWFNSNKQDNLDLSSIIFFENWKDLTKVRNKFLQSSNIYEGIMLKKKNSIYHNGRPRGMWYKWKRDPKSVDAILMYAQRGHGKRSSYYSDYTFGVLDGKNLVPIGKAYSGYTNEELDKLDKFVRKNTIQKFGPVREVEKTLVFEIAFDSISKSKRHKSGLALRFPRISKIRWDKSPEEIEDLKRIKDFYKLS